MLEDELGVYGDNLSVLEREEYEVFATREHIAIELHIERAARIRRLEAHSSDIDARYRVQMGSTDREEIRDIRIESQCGE